MTASPLLEMTGIAKAFGPVQALQNVDFRLRHGEIHALAGENGAGKSTLMRIIDGILQPDEGEIRLDGKPLRFSTPLEAQQAGIGFVHQEIALCPDVSVAENVCMATINASRSFLVNYRRIRREARAVLQQLVDIDPDAPLNTLSISSQQVVEIAKALTLDCRILILDEPTAALTERESEALFKIMHRLKAKGISIIYISHRMAEIFAHCDHITVLRDGRYVMDAPIAETTPEAVVNSMVGRELSHLYPDKLSTPPQQGETILSVRGLSDDGLVRDVNFDLHEGEILGLAGLIGAGRSETVQTICGLKPRTAGTVSLKGREIRINGYPDAVAEGIVYLSEDRKGEGVFLDLTIAQNVSALRLDKVTTPLGLIDRRAEQDQAQALTDELNLKSGGIGEAVSSLSGGNQQKVAIAKLLTADPAVVILDEPTRGIDVGAKSEIHALLRRFAQSGVGVIVVSSELPEVIGLCDRVLVLCEGRQSGTLEGDDVTEEAIIALASDLTGAALSDMPVAGPAALDSVQ